MGVKREEHRIRRRLGCCVALAAVWEFGCTPGPPALNSLHGAQPCSAAELRCALCCAGPGHLPQPRPAPQHPARHELYDTRSDVWSWGVMCVELLAQQKPYAHLYATPVQIALQVGPPRRTPRVSTAHLQA